MKFFHLSANYPKTHSKELKSFSGPERSMKSEKKNNNF